MAETFVAVRRGPAGFEQHVCIKRILPAYESDRDFIESFLQEARTSAALRHANIVQLLDFGVAEGAHYLALELIDGLDLRALQLASPGGRLPADVITLIAGDLCAALEHAHADDLGRPKLVHRDISPSNVLVSRAGEVKLTDFGIARPSGGAQRTATGVIKGKVPYMPPEYIERGLFDERGDLFSLGVMLYELLAGQRPFDGNNDLDTIRRILAGSHTPLQTLAPHAPQALIGCVEALLTTDSARRVPSARALLDALPGLQVHQTRRRLADLVRAQLGSGPSRVPSTPPGALSKTVPLPRTPATPARAAEPHAAEPTRTVRRGTRRAPSRGPLLALAGALACLGAVGLIALLNSDALSALEPLPQPALPAAGQPLPSIPQPPASAPLPPASAASAAAPKPTASPAPEPAQPESEPDSEEEPIILSRPSDAPNERVRRAAAALRPHATSAAHGQAELNVYVQPFGEVWVDGRRAGQSPVTLKLAPGAHEIGVGDGRIEQRQSVQLAAGAHESVEIRRRDIHE
jgi:serine/threonine protein kinase